MKRKYLLTLLPLVALVGCTAQNVKVTKEHGPYFERGEENGLPTIGFAGVAAMGGTLHPAAEHPAVLHSLRHQHGYLPPSLRLALPSTSPL